MAAASRPPPALCEVCATFPTARIGVGFPAHPSENPGLPEALVGSVVWICGAPDCLTAARTRAIRAAGRAGLTAVRLARVHHYPKESDAHA